MKYLIAFLILAFAAARSTEEVQSLWSSWKRSYGRTYSAVEERTRFSVFSSNVDLVDSLNAARTLPEEASYNLTKFADLSPAEFKQLYLMDEARLAPLARAPSRVNVAGAVKNHFITAPPASWDWRTKNVVTPVKNQGQCGSCWDFSATETIESVCAIAGYPLTGLSEQQILSCDVGNGDMGCAGGWPYGAYQYVINAGGMDTEANYPYTAEGGSSTTGNAVCNVNKANFYNCPVESWKYVEQNNNEQTMQTFMAANSPLSICVDAETWQFYSSGVMMKKGCGTSIDHCVQAVGWGNVGSTAAWIVRNSWGTDWGLDGYINVQLGVDACAIAQVVTVPCVKSPSGQTVC